jgi:glutamate-1-semialdehyde aminotransferase
MGRKTEQSRKLQRRAEAVIPGGVDSPVRAFRAVGGRSAVHRARRRLAHLGRGRE